MMICAGNQLVPKLPDNSCYLRIIYSPGISQGGCNKKSVIYRCLSKTSEQKLAILLLSQLSPWDITNHVHFLYVFS